MTGGLPARDRQKQVCLNALKRRKTNVSAKSAAPHQRSDRYRSKYRSAMRSAVKRADTAARQSVAIDFVNPADRIHGCIDAIDQEAGHPRFDQLGHRSAIGRDDRRAAGERLDYG